MYFGSVRFFKHIILFLVFGIIAVLAVLTVVFGINNNDNAEKVKVLTEKNKALQSVVDFNNGTEDFTVGEYYDLLTYFDISLDELLSYLYDNNKEAYEALVEAQPTSLSGLTLFETDSGTLPEVTLPTPTETTPITTTPPTETEIDTETTETVAEPPAYQELFPHLYVNTNANPVYTADENYVYLTFDDGPSIYTNDVLNILSDHDVKATFFVIPDNTEASKNYLNRMLDAGHTVGVHSMTHVYDKIYASVEAFLDDFNDAFNLIYDQTGYRPMFFRFPGGSKNDYNGAVRADIIAEMERRGFIYYDWNVDSRDSAGALWTEMYDSVLIAIEDLKRSVVLFHDGPSSSNTVYVLEDIIKALEKDPRNYVFSAINENTRPQQF